MPPVRSQARQSATEFGERVASNASDAAESVARSPALARLARVGLAARATIYVLLGILSLQLATGSHKEVDQNGALRTIDRQSYGPVVLSVLLVGFVAYALWRLTEVFYGEVGGGKGIKERVSSAFRVLAYLALALTTVSVVLHGSTRRGSASANRALSAGLLQHAWGRVLVGIVGLVAAVVGCTMVYEGWKKKFERYLRVGQMSDATRRIVIPLGRYGTMARGVVFVVVGLLTLRAAWQHDPKDAGGIDEAVKTMARTPGSWLLWVVALGLLAFGAYGFAEARWRRTERTQHAH